MVTHEIHTLILYNALVWISRDEPTQKRPGIPYKIFNINMFIFGRYCDHGYPTPFLHFFTSWRAVIHCKSLLGVDMSMVSVFTVTAG